MNGMNFFSTTWCVNVEAIRSVCYGKGIHAGSQSRVVIEFVKSYVNTDRFLVAV